MSVLKRKLGKSEEIADFGLRIAALKMDSYSQIRIPLGVPGGCYLFSPVGA